MMAASFHNTEEIKGLVGCDRLAISTELTDLVFNPKLLKKMAKDKKLEPVLTVEKAKQSDLEEVNVTENLFYFQLSEDEMATAKLDEGIMKFAADVVESKKMIDKYI
ncbi:Transaldolase [Aphelenchoides besseyi]|nr:Transaldolase [Aphelenchoides besseyi]